MSDPALLPPFEDLAPFKFVGENPALDLVNTVDWTRVGLRRDRLANYNRLTEWAEGAGVLSAGDATLLRTRTGPGRAVHALAMARRTRLSLRGAFRRVALGKPVDSELEALNRLLAGTLPRRRLEKSGRVAAYSWNEWGVNPSCLLWPVILSGADLLTSEEALRVGMCPSEDCGWMFVDRSRNGMRRWCEMATCGTMEKNRRRRRDRPTRRSR